MELQWFLLAEAFRMRPSGVLDIAGIFRTVTVEEEPLMPVFHILGKVKFDPTNAGEETSFIFRLLDLDRTWQEEVELPFTYPNLEQWTRGALPLIRCSLSDFDFPHVGEYAVEIHHGGNLIGSETFMLALRQEEDHG